VYAEIVGQNYPREASPGVLQVPAPQLDRKTVSLAEWHDPKDHFSDVLTSAGNTAAEIEESYQYAIDHGQLSVRQAVRNYRAGVAADLVAYEGLVHYLKPLFSNPSEALQSQQVALYVDKALVHKVLGDIGGALALYDAAAELLEPNIGERLVGDQIKSDLAIVYSNKAETLEKLNKLAEAEDLLRRAIDLLERVIDGSPDLRDVLAGAHLNLAEVLRRRNLAADALTHYDRAIALREKRDGSRDQRHSDKLANAYLTKTNALKALGKIEDARDAASRAVSVCQQALGDEQPASDRLFEALFAEADCCRILGQYQTAIGLITRAIDGYKQLTFDHGRRQLQARLANALMLHGTILLQAKQSISLAEDEMKAGIAIYEQLVLKEGAREVAHDLFTCYSRLGGLYQSYRRVDAAVELYDKAIEMWSRLPSSETQGNRLHDLAKTYLNKAIVIEHRSQPNWKEVNSVYEQAIKVWEELLEQGHFQFRGDLARAMLLRAPIWRRLGEPARVRADAGRWLPILRDEARKTGRTEFKKVADWAHNNLR
jgi:tetratricopeptide (TPR) repeat protein